MLPGRIANCVTPYFITGMRRNTIALFAAIVAAFTFPAGAANAESQSRADEVSAKKALGVYTGAFGSNKITLRLEKIEGNSVIGSSEVGGNKRPFRGPYVVRSGIPEFEVQEPGDHPQDGAFRFHFLPEEQALVGRWGAQDSKLADITFRLVKTPRTATEAAASPSPASKAYSPAPGSRERKAIVKAARAAYQERFPNNRKKMEVRTLTVQDGWAGTYIFFSGKHEDDFDLWLAVLRGSGNNWKVAGAFRTSDISEEDDPFERLLARHPSIPPAVVEALNVQ